MFHLLVSYRGWDDQQDSVSNNRIYIKPENDSQRTFLKDNGNLNLEKISSIPALLVTETDGEGPQIARVARITHLIEGSSETEIFYTVDTSVPSISNEELETFAPQLHLSNFGLRHSCWRICEADLYRILLQNEYRRQPLPRVFSINNPRTSTDRFVSVMMPFSREFDSVYTTIKSAAADLKLDCSRADNVWNHDLIIQDIVDLIAHAEIVICDCTTRNANVFYEIGIAHSLGKEVILLTQNPNDIPFDVQHLRHINYSNDALGLKRLSVDLKNRMAGLQNLRTG